MYKNLMNDGNQKTNGSDATASATPKTSQVNDALKAPKNAKGLTMGKLFNTMELMVTTMDEELGIRDKRLDRLDEDVVDHEGRIAALEKGGRTASSEDSFKEFDKKWRAMLDEFTNSAMQKAVDSMVSSKPEKADEPKVTVSSSSVAAGYTGPGRAYKYWDYKTRTYGMTSRVFAAKQIDPGYDPVYVWYDKGQIDHILNEDEIRKYVP